MDNERLNFFLVRHLVGDYVSEKHKFKKGDFVSIKIGDRKINTVVIELVDGLFYKLDWSMCGYNSLLNTVRIPEKSLI